MQTWNDVFDNVGNTKFSLFNNGKIKVKHWNIGLTIPLEKFSNVLLIQLQFGRSFHSFL
jgi:hypothetical protein